MGGDEYESQLGNSLYRTTAVSSSQVHREHLRSECIAKVAGDLENKERRTTDCHILDGCYKAQAERHLSL